MLTRHSWLAAGLWAALSAAGAAAGAPENLLTNGDFAALGQDGLPTGWRVGSSAQGVARDPIEPPAGCTQSLRVEIRQASRNYGEIEQKVAVRPSSAYVLEGLLRATAPATALFQVKLYKDGKELARIQTDKNGEGWTAVTKAFHAAGADHAGIICRWVQSPDAVGRTAWFARVRLTAAPPGELTGLEAVATFECVGLRAGYRGAVAPAAACRVRCRRAGEAAWRRGLDLVPYPPENEFRGSLFGLAPDTAYEVECELAEGEAAGSFARPVRAEARTWAEDVPIGQVRRLPEGLSREPLVIRDQGRPDAWILYAPPPGKASTLDAGTAADQAVLIEDAAYVLVEGLTLRGGRKDCLRVAKSHDVRIRRCDMAGWGDAGTRKDGLPKGLYVDAAGRVINYQAGVRVADGSTRVVVEGNFIHEPRGTANAWRFGHPVGPQGIILANTGGNNVVRDNDLVGSERHWWNDAIESIANREVTGGPYRDTDIYGNVLAFSNDDGTELDGGQINVRYWHNWIDKALCGVSCAPNRRGPSYVFRNLIVLTGEEFFKTGAGFKMGGDQFRDPGLSLLLNNTVYTDGHGLTSGHFGPGPTPICTRNNVFAGPLPGCGRIRYRHLDGGDFDCDLVPPGGIYGVSPLPPAWEAHAVVGRPKFRDEAAGDFRLSPDSPGVDAALLLPGLNDAFAGKAPDMGAMECRPDAPAVFPPRRSGMSALPMHAHLARRGGPAPHAEVVLLAPADCGARWQAFPNAPWLRCLPASGPCGAEPQKVTIEADAALEPRLHRAAVTFRTDEGLCRTVMADLKAYPPRLVAVSMEAEQGQIQGGMRIVRDAAASGGAYVDTPEIVEKPPGGEEQRRGDPGSVTLAFELPEDADYYIAARCMVPGPTETAGVHDSFQFALDGGQAQVWDVPNASVGYWQWSLVGVRVGSRSEPLCVRLARGAHKLVISSREALTRLDRIVVTNSPYPEPPEAASP